MSTMYKYRYELVLGLGILLYGMFMLYSLVSGLNAFFTDNVFFIGIAVFLYFFRTQFALKIPVYVGVIVGFSMHSAGVFGFYGNSPFPIQYDHVNHFITMFFLGLLCYGALQQFMDKRWTKRNMVLIILIFLAAFGIGAVGEMFEFAGYLTFGFGDGALQFGDGDSIQGIAASDVVDYLGGGWINTGWDLIYNALGVLLAMIVGLVAYRKKQS